MATESVRLAAPDTPNKCCEYRELGTEAAASASVALAEKLYPDTRTWKRDWTPEGPASSFGAYCGSSPASQTGTAFYWMSLLATRVAACPCFALLLFAGYVRATFCFVQLGLMPVTYFSIGDYLLQRVLILAFGIPSVIGAV